MTEDNKSSRQNLLRQEIVDDLKMSTIQAKKFDRYAAIWRALMVAFSLASVLIGLGDSLRSEPHLNPAVYSALAAVTAATTALWRKFNWLEQSEIWHTRREQCKRILIAMDYEYPQTLDAETLQIVAASYALILDLHEDRMTKLRRLLEVDWSRQSSPPESRPK
ncbi:hypothetical protein [Caballeronia sordidicola]|uniref:hypothetical protein n=1 Tax=Caballeronia sordidicola TaxID=196367 RepID=UPI000AB86291|nr:hypothetical protein [Caballeronia sordidicola]